MEESKERIRKSPAPAADPMIQEILAELKEAREASAKLSAELAAMKADIPNAANLIETVEGQLAPKIIEGITNGLKGIVVQIPAIVQQQTEAAMKANVEGIKKGVADEILKQQGGAAEPAPEEAPTAPGGLTPDWFLVGKGFASGILDGVDKLSPVLKILMPSKQPDMNARIDDAMHLIRFQNAGGDINALKGFVGGADKAG